jgi:cobalt-zinc-cadmium resistance protein CzcA
MFRNPKLRNLHWLATKRRMKSKREQFVNQKKKLAKYQEAINYYNQYGKKLSMKSSKVGNGVINGEIDFFNTFKV